MAGGDWGGLSLRGTVRAEGRETRQTQRQTDRHAGMETEGRLGQTAVRAHAHVCTHTHTCWCGQRQKTPAKGAGGGLDGWWWVCAGGWEQRAEGGPVAGALLSLRPGTRVLSYMMQHLVLCAWGSLNRSLCFGRYFSR